MRFFKRIRIGIRLVSNAFKTLIFHHDRYFIFCSLLTLTDGIRIVLMQSLNTHFSVSMFLNEFLMGKSFFEQLVDQFAGPLFSKQFFVVLLSSFLFFLQLFIMFLLYIAAIYYSQHTSSQISFKTAFVYSWNKKAVIFTWSFIECMVQFGTALLVGLGDILYFIWQLSTAFVLPIITFQEISIGKLVKHALKAFRSRFESILAADAYLELILLLLTVLYHSLFSHDKAIAFTFLAPHSLLYSSVVVTAIFYVHYCVTLAEAIALGALYTQKDLYENN